MNGQTRITRYLSKALTLNFPDFRLHYKATVGKTVVLAQKLKKTEKDRKPRDKLTHLWSADL